MDARPPNVGLAAPLVISRISRRRALIGAVTSVSLACTRRGSSPPAGAPAAATVAAPAAGGGDAAAAWGGLQVAIGGGHMRDDERGGTAVVLLHGWGAPGDDLVALAQELDRPRARFFVPAAPLPEVGGGRAWWHLDQADRPRQAVDDQPPSTEVLPRLKTVRTAVQAMLRTIRARYAPQTLCIAGFSQGAMLALDVALAADPPVDRVAALSGVLLADSVAGLRAATAAPRPAVFVSHGRQDSVLPFPGGDLAQELLRRHGFNVVFHPFDGGHALPPDVIGALRVFLFQGT